MKRKLLFRADGNGTTGLGHLYRLFSLVEMVKEHYDFIFLTNEESTLEVIPKDYAISKIPEDVLIENEPEWINTNFPAQSFSIIADGYHFNSTYQKAIKQYGFNLMYIDDLANEKMYADIVINHSPYLKTSAYDKQSYTQLALGTSYALLRPAFLKAAQYQREVNSIDTAFVCFGGADPYNLSIKVIKALFVIEDIKHIHLVLGGAYKHNEILDLLETHSNVLTIHRNLSEHELVSIMQLSQLAIAPASTILYELCCVKMPILSGYYVDNQELIYNGFLEKGAIYEGGNMKDYSQSDFEFRIKHILDKKNHDVIMKSQNKLFDSRIKTRHIDLIKQIC